MMQSRNHQKSRGKQKAEYLIPLEQTISSREISVATFRKPARDKSGEEKSQNNFGEIQKEKYSTSDSQLFLNDKSRYNDHEITDATNQLSQAIGDKETPELTIFSSEDTQMKTSEDQAKDQGKKKERPSRQHYRDRNEAKCGKSVPAQRSPCVCDIHTTPSEESISRKIREIHNDARKRARVIRDSKARLQDLQKKPSFTEADIKEIAERNELLLREMDRFDLLTRSVQTLVTGELSAHIGKPREQRRNDPLQYIPGSVYEPAMFHEMKMNHPTVILGRSRIDNPGLGCFDRQLRSKSEIDLTRKLNESYDMQEKLVADNADLEVKRYILYKELMTKDMAMETCRAQINRLQGELKMMNNENVVLLERLNKNNPQGDASAMIKKTCSCSDTNPFDKPKKFDQIAAEQLIVKLENYKCSTVGLEKQLGELEYEVRHIQTAMSKPPGACRSAGGQNTCFIPPPSGPPVPPTSKACGVCPPCPAPCNPDGPPNHAEKEVSRLTIALRQTEELYKAKVAESAMLRAENIKKKEELEMEQCQHREAKNKLRELEMKFEGLATHTNMMLGTKEQAFENEVNVRTLKGCYREAMEEIEELRAVTKELNEQLQGYRVKYLQAQQLVEEQKRQMDMMDMDNTRISEQINMEIQRVKLKFQEKLQELAPLPDLLKATQLKLKDAQQSQAVAEHNSEALARELNVARERVHAVLHSAVKPAEKEKDPVRANEEKLAAILQSRVTQLTEINQSLKTDVERLKNNMIRMEEQCLAYDKRLQEKMHECAALGGDLDRFRDEAARALQRANERTDTVKRCMQTTIAEMEKQLAFTRSQVTSSSKEREELQARMQCQIKRLTDNFEQAQYRITGLTTQVNNLRKSASMTGEDKEPDEDCLCRNMFNEL